MITGHSDSHAAMRAVFEMGATGFISKPFSDIDLISRAHSYLDLTRKMEQLEKLKGVDRLTGLSNYNSFEEHGRKTLSISMRHDLDLTVVYLELNPFGEMKKEIGRIVSVGGICITCGWNSGGVGKKYGFEIDEILLVAHGGWHNDTIVTVERKVR